MRNLSLFFLLLFLSAQALAQFTDSTSHYLRFSATGNLNRSNDVASYLLTNDARFSIKTKRNTFNTVANWLYGEQGDRLTNNDFTSISDYNWYRDSSNLYYWALANYTTSYSLKISSQLQTGLGAAYNFVNNSKAWLNLSEGILYEASRLALDEPEQDQFHIIRNSLRLTYRFVVARSLTLTGTNFLQQAIGDGSDYIIRTSNSLNVKLNDWFGIRSTISYNQFQRTGTENLLFTYGVVAETWF
ncbi:MAG TPA: DUF481 domain-containing protein [Flavisolibacter sp.]|nr:DUF481 domain-containing protein [Flavisolibacter sp.]